MSNNLLTEYLLKLRPRDGNSRAYNKNDIFGEIDKESGQ